MDLKSRPFWVHKNFTNDDYTIYREDGKEITVSIVNGKVAPHKQAKIKVVERQWFVKNEIV